MKRLLGLGVLLIILLTGCAKDSAPPTPGELAPQAVGCNEETMTHDFTLYRAVAKHIIDKKAGPNALQVFASYNDYTLLRNAVLTVENKKHKTEAYGFTRITTGTLILKGNLQSTKHRILTIDFKIHCYLNFSTNKWVDPKVEAIYSWSTSKTTRYSTYTKVMSYDSRHPLVTFTEASGTTEADGKHLRTRIYQLKAVSRGEFYVGKRLHTISGDAKQSTPEPSFGLSYRRPYQAPGAITPRQGCEDACSGYQTTYNNKVTAYNVAFEAWRTAVEDVEADEGRVDTAKDRTVTAGIALVIGCIGNMITCGLGATIIIAAAIEVVRAENQVTRAEGKAAQKAENLEQAERAMNNAALSLQKCMERECGMGCVPAVLSWRPYGTASQA